MWEIFNPAVKHMWGGGGGSAVRFNEVITPWHLLGHEKQRANSAA